DPGLGAGGEQPAKKACPPPVSLPSCSPLTLPPERRHKLGLNLDALSRHPRGQDLSGPEGSENFLWHRPVAQTPRCSLALRIVHKTSRQQERESSRSSFLLRE